jgi:hypothetical protein
MFSGTPYSSRVRPSALPLLLMLVFCAPTAHAQSVLNRCIGSDGTSIFTDQKCGDIGAIQRADPPPVAGNIGDGIGRPRVPACARRPEDLRDAIENAIRAGDVNRFAAFYHWPGVSSTDSAAIFKHLQALVARPLLSIDLQYPAVSRDEYGLEMTDGSRLRRAFGVQIVQSRSERDATPIRSVLALRRNIGCWWVQF